MLSRTPSAPDLHDRDRALPVVDDTRGDAHVVVAGVDLVADLSGVLLWPDARMLVVADLHLEKGSAHAARGMPLPPYDTAATLTRLAMLVARHDPAIVIALGDSFHDRGATARLSPQDRERLGLLQRGREWIWIAGNHDPEPHADVGGVCAETLVVRGLVFRHEPGGALPGAAGEIGGHLHPCARIVQRGRSLVRRCFACDGRRMILPAFGAFTGGLNIRDDAFSRVFGGAGFTAHLIGDRRLYALPAERCAH